MLSDRKVRREGEEKPGQETTVTGGGLDDAGLGRKWRCRAGEEVEVRLPCVLTSAGLLR